jgi:hypothetical protein
MRAATADRERAVDVLKAAFAEGRLSQDEYNDRMGRAYEARTYGDLAALTADLPAGPLPVPGYPHWVPVRAAKTIICGHVANHQISQTGERGSGLAATGLVLGYLGAAIWSIFFVAAVAWGARHGVQVHRYPFGG